MESITISSNQELTNRVRTNYFYSGEKFDKVINGEKYLGFKRDYSSYPNGSSSSSKERTEYNNLTFSSSPTEKVEIDESISFYINEKFFLQKKPNGLKIKNVVFQKGRSKQNNIPIITGAENSSLVLENCVITGGVEIKVQKGVNVVLSDVEAKGHILIDFDKEGDFEIARANIDGEQITLKNVFLNDYIIFGKNVNINSQILNGQPKKSFVDGVNIEIVSNDYHQLVATDIYGTNVKIENSSVSNGRIFDGVKIKNCKLFGTKKETQKYCSASRILNSEINGKVVVSNSDITDSKLKFSLKETDEQFCEITDSAINSCFGKMPISIVKSILEDCKDITFKSIKNSELKYLTEKNMFDHIKQREKVKNLLLTEKPKGYRVSLEDKFISPTKFEERERKVLQKEEQTYKKENVF